MKIPYMGSRTAAVAVMVAVLAFASAAQAANCTSSGNKRAVKAFGDWPYAVINARVANKGDLWDVTSRKFTKNGNSKDTNTQRLAVTEKFNKVYRQEIRSDDGKSSDSTMVVKFALQSPATASRTATCTFRFHANSSDDGSVQKTQAYAVGCAKQSFIACKRQYKGGNTPKWEFDITLGKPSS